MSKNLVLLALSGALALTCTLANAEMYKVNVKRTDSNLYIDRSNKILIKTKYCYEYTYGDDAILVYERGSYSNKLVFENGTSCDVESVSSF
jgi:hypothetical protein